MANNRAISKPIAVILIISFPVFGAFFWQSVAEKRDDYIEAETVGNTLREVIAILSEDEEFSILEIDSISDFSAAKIPSVLLDRLRDAEIDFKESSSVPIEIRVNRFYGFEVTGASEVRWIRYK